MVDYTELRAHPRVNVDFFADWGWGPECEYYDRVTCLSLGGCFLATKRELNSGDEIHLRLSPQGTGPISLKAAVRSQLRISESAPPSGAGVEFLGLSDDDRTRLQMVIDSYKETA